MIRYKKYKECIYHNKVLQKKQAENTIKWTDLSIEFSILIEYAHKSIHTWFYIRYINYIFLNIKLTILIYIFVY